MKWRLVVRRERARRAIVVGLVSMLMFGFLGAERSIAAGAKVYLDPFVVAGSYVGSTGPDAWSGPWVEAGDDGLPDSGAMTVESEADCPNDVCLVIGKEGMDAATVTRGFDSAGASKVTLSFTYQRHVHGAGDGEVRVLASSDGSSFGLVQSYPLSVDDADPQSGTFDITSVASATSAIGFELVGGVDNSHFNLDEVAVVVEFGTVPTFNQNLEDRTDAENATVSIDSGATDAEPGSLLYSAASLPPGIGIDAATGEISGTIGYTAAAGSPYPVEIKVADGDGNVAIDTFTWTVTNVNRPPTAADRSASVAEDDTDGVTIDLESAGFVSDADGDVVVLDSLDLSGLVGGSVIDNGDGTVTYTPDPDFDGTDGFSYVATDGTDPSAPANVVITITASEDDPTLAPIPSISVPEGALATFDAVADDPDTGDSLSYSLVAGPDPVPTGASVDAAGRFTWLTDEADGPGSYAFKLRVTDSTNRFVERPVSVDVTEANQAPMLDPISDRSDAEGAVVTLTMTVTDPDLPAPTLTFTVAGLPPGLTFDSGTGTISGTIEHTAAASSPFSVTVTVHDDHAPPGVDAETFTWTVADVNRAPAITAIPADATLAPGEAYSSSVSASDPDGDPLGYAATGLPSGLAIDGFSGAITGTVGPSVTAGTYPVDVVVTDTAGADDSASFALTIATPPTTTTTTTSTTTSTTTTSTTTTTTTTTTAPTTTTTAPAAPSLPRRGTTTTVPEPTTTTTTLPAPSVGTTTTTIAVEPAPPTTVPESEPSVDVPEPMTQQRAQEVKEDLVVAVAVDTRPPPGSDGPRPQLTPREGLSVSFVSAVETLRTQFASAMLLGIGMAVLLLLGVDRRGAEESGAPPAAA